MDDKVDLDDYIAPGIDEGYDPDEDDEQNGAHDELGSDSGEEPMDEEDLDDESEPEPQPVKKKIVADKKGSKSSFAVSGNSSQNVFSDFDKKNKKRAGIKITFQNPLLSKHVADEEEDNPLKKRVYSIKMANKKQHEEDEEQHNDYFQGEDEDDEDAIGPVQDKKAKFKDRMKEKKKQAKLDKEKKRNEKKAEREAMFSTKDKRTADLELIAGDQDEEEVFKPNFNDTRFVGRFNNHEMAVDPTSTMYVKDKHMQINKVKKSRQAQN